MKVKAEAKYQRVSERKVKRVLDLVRGKKAQEALTILKFLPHSAAKLALYALMSAVANAKHNYKMEPESLVVSECYVGRATPLKRIRPRARGRAFSRIRRFSHITMFVEAK
jgi:large subunit ribosomal protein L22